MDNYKHPAARRQQPDSVHAAAAATNTAHAAATHGHGRLWLIAPIMGAVVMILAGVMVLNHGQGSIEVSQLHRELRDIALRQSERGAIDNGGPVGPWWIAASRVNPFTNEYEDFRVRSGDMLIAAASATLEVDVERDTFQFNLRDVVFTRTRSAKDLPQGDALWTLPTHTLGPAPYGKDVIADADGGALTNKPAPERTRNALLDKAPGGRTAASARDD